MELRDFAERVLFAGTLQEKLACPTEITDERPGPALMAPEAPGRPPELRFKPQNTGKADIPQVHQLDRPGERGRLLHFFANHELLATELMALVLLRFPQAPPAFRRAVLQTLQDEQEHTRWYMHRMADCGVTFGELPVSGYFWRSVASMTSPLDYVTGLSLTFEQANLDFARFFARGFAQVGDAESARLLERVYRDEIGHVAFGLKWFRKWKDPAQSDWVVFQRQLKFPLSAQRAKGPGFNVEGRLVAGFDREFIDQLNIFAQSKGRTPGVFLFNPFGEEYIAGGLSFTPNKNQQRLQQDLETLPQFLSRQDDVVLVHRKPAIEFLGRLKEVGFAVPEFVELRQGSVSSDCPLLARKLGSLRPWAWSPDSIHVLGPLFENLTQSGSTSGETYNPAVASLYSKEWSARLLRSFLSGNPAACGGKDTLDKPAETSWLCSLADVGVAAATLSEVSEQIRLIRGRGHHAIVVKQALGVAGQNAIRLLEPEVLASQRRWIERALENGQRLVVEPWLERLADFSVQLEMSSQGLKLLGYVELLNDWKGQYQGNRAGPGFKRRIGLDLANLFSTVPNIWNNVQRLYSEIFVLLERELLAVRYSGPIGIDALVYRGSPGQSLLKPIVEINPRYTMGRVTLELMHNVAPGSTGTLRLISRPAIKAEGFHDFPSWARSLSERSPVLLAGDPLSKIREGFLCLADPAAAQVCLPVLVVTKTG